MCMQGMLTDMSYCLPIESGYTYTKEYVVHGKMRGTFSAVPDAAVAHNALCIAFLLDQKCEYLTKASLSQASSRRIFGIDDLGDASASNASSFMQSSRQLTTTLFLDYSVVVPPGSTQKQMIDAIGAFVNGSGHQYVAFSNWLDGNGIYITDLQETVPPTVTNSTVVRLNGVIIGYPGPKLPLAAAPKQAEEDNVVLWVLLGVGGAILLTVVIATSAYVWRYGSCVKAEC